MCCSGEPSISKSLDGCAPEQVAPEFMFLLAAHGRCVLSRHQPNRTMPLGNCATALRTQLDKLDATLAKSTYQDAVFCRDASLPEMMGYRSVAPEERIRRKRRADGTTRWMRRQRPA